MIEMEQRLATMNLARSAEIEAERRKAVLAEEKARRLEERMSASPPQHSGAPVGGTHVTTPPKAAPEQNLSLIHI